MNVFCTEFQGDCWEKAPWKLEPRSTEFCLCLLTPPQEMQLFCMAGISVQNFQHPHKSVTKAGSSTHGLWSKGEEKTIYGLSQCQKKCLADHSEYGTQGESPLDKPTQENVTVQMSTSWDRGSLGSYFGPQKVHLLVKNPDFFIGK